MKLKTIFTFTMDNPYENNCNSYFIGGNVQALIDPGLTGIYPICLIGCPPTHQERRISLRYQHSFASRPFSGFGSF